MTDDKSERFGACLDGDSSEPDVILGVDPGRQGVAVALSLATNEAKIFELETELVGGVLVPRLPRGLLRINREVKILAAIEHVKGRGGWSAQVNFRFGGYAMSIAALLKAIGYDLSFVKPHVWKKHFGIERADKAKGQTSKDKTLEAYLRLFGETLPRTKQGRLDHNLVDAFLIAAYTVQDLGYPFRYWKFSKNVHGAIKLKNANFDE